MSNTQRMYMLNMMMDLIEQVEQTIQQASIAPSTPKNMHYAEELDDLTDLLVDDEEPKAQATIQTTSSYAQSTPFCSSFDPDRI